MPKHFRDLSWWNKSLIMVLLSETRLVALLENASFPTVFIVPYGFD